MFKRSAQNVKLSEMLYTSYQKFSKKNKKKEKKFAINKYKLQGNHNGKARQFIKAHLTSQNVPYKNNMATP